MQIADILPYSQALLGLFIGLLVGGLLMLFLSFAHHSRKQRGILLLAYLALSLLPSLGLLLTGQAPALIIGTAIGSIALVLGGYGAFSTMDLAVALERAEQQIDELTRRLRNAQGGASDSAIEADKSEKKAGAGPDQSLYKKTASGNRIRVRGR